MKLVGKTRRGSTVRKKYDKAKTPYQRVLDCRVLSKEAQEDLKKTYATLNPVKLGRQISHLQDRIDALAKAKREAQETLNLEYIPT